MGGPRWLVGPMATTAFQGWPHHPSSPFPLVRHGGAKEEGCPSSTYIYKCHVGFLIKQKIGENPINLTTPPTTSPPLSYPVAPSKGRAREGYLPRITPSCCRNSTRRSTSATSVGSEGPGVVVIHRMCVSTRGCQCGTSHCARIVTTLRSASFRLNHPRSSQNVKCFRFGLQEVCCQNHPVTALLIDRSWLVLELR